MDTLETSNESQDWEVLHSDSDHESDPVKSAGSVNSLDEIDSGGLIQANHFSLDAQNRQNVEELDDNKSSESDNPSWIDPGLDENPTRYLNKEPCEFWSDSSSEQSEKRKLNYLEGNTEMGISKKGVYEVGFEGIDVGSTKFDDFSLNSEMGAEGNVNLHNESEVSAIEKNESETTGSGFKANESGDKKIGEIGKSGIVWWKMPMDSLRYCVFRKSPVWTVSLAAAVMGFMVLGHRLYKMKKKTRGLEIKVTIDDKKVSQVMSRAARMNEAFSVVKRVPVIRPSMPALGQASWPVMSLR